MTPKSLERIKVLNLNLISNGSLSQGEAIEVKKLARKYREWMPENLLEAVGTS